MSNSNRDSQYIDAHHTGDWSPWDEHVPMVQPCFTFKYSLEERDLCCMHVRICVCVRERESKVAWAVTVLGNATNNVR
jgi:hypothetical protein